MVFLYHNRKFWRNDIPLALLKLINEFHVGVSIFFVLSGFIITYTYQLRPLENHKSFIKYYLTRLARIFPVYLILLTVRYWVNGFPSLKEGALTYSLLNGFSDIYNLHGIPQAWTLCVELCFYFTMPFIYYYFKKQRSKSLLLPVIVLVATFTIGYTWHWINGNKDSFFYPADFIFNASFPGRCFEFLIGIFLADTYLHQPEKLQILKNKTLWGGILSLLVIYSISYFEPDIFHDGTSHPMGIAIRNLILPLTVAVFLAGLMTEKNWVQQLLSTRLMVLLGNASFAFYLIHMGTINNYLFDKNPIHDRAFILLWVASILIYLLVEKPLYEWCKKGISLIGKGHTAQPSNA